MPCPIELHVAPDGERDADASHDQPLTLPAALDRVRQLRQERPDQSIEVLLQGGTYAITEPMVLGPEHSGTPTSPVTVRAAEGQRPVISSARPISGWKPLDHDLPGLSEDAAEHLWYAEVGDARFRTLYHAGHRLPRARVGPLASDPDREDDATPTELPAMPADLRDWHAPDVDLFVIPKHIWQAQYLPVESINRERNVITTRLEATYEMVCKPGRSKYWLENIPEGMSEPGAWMLDTRQGRVYLWPLDAAEPTDIACPALTELLRIEGTPDQPTRHVTLRGITLTQGDWIHWPENRRAAQHDWQVHDWPDALVGLKHTQSITVEHCRFTDSGSTGLRMDRTAIHNTVTRCDFTRLGGSAIAILGNEPGERESSHHNTLSANLIHDIAELWWQASGIFLHQSGYNEIVDNHIYNTSYGAITLVSGREGAFGKTPRNRGKNGSLVADDAFGDAPFEWQYTIGHLACRHNRVAYNDVHDVMQKCGDGNGIYLSGTGWGNLIEGNFVHDIPGAGVHSAIRTDDMQWYTRIERNLICRCHGAGITLKHVNDISDNVIVDTLRMGALIIRRSPSWGANIKRNVITLSEIPDWLATPPEPFFSDGGKMGGVAEQTHLDDNLIWCPANPEHARACHDALVQRGLQQHGMAADPNFLDPSTDDYRLHPDSPAHQLGIRSLTGWGPRETVGSN